MSRRTSAIRRVHRNRRRYSAARLAAQTGVARDCHVNAEFLASVSHELRTPLHAILGYIQLILDGTYGEVSQPIRDALDRMDMSGNHLLGLINDLLDLSKFRTGQFALSIKDYSLPDVVHTVVTALEPLARNSGLALRVVLPDEVPIARGDERRIAQVLLNLVGNAIKFTSTGKVTVEASVRGDSFTISVTDTGPGISETEQDAIFREFYQAPVAEKPKQPGAGLGLPIAKRLVELHGGCMWVESNPGAGATFSFSVPVRVEDDLRLRD